MATVLHLTIPGRPAAWRLGRRAGQAAFFKDTECRKFQKRVAAEAAKRCKKPLHINKEVWLTIYVYLHYSQTYRLLNESGHWRKQVPDLTNVVKAIEDALTGIVYDDDIQVKEIRASRLWTSQDKNERIEITVEDFNLLRT